jgi:hypothetical protein
MTWIQEEVEVPKQLQVVGLAYEEHEEMTVM